jgi:hypothetical protein
VKCSDVATNKIKRTFYWHPPAWYLLIFLNILIYAIVALAVRKKAVLEVWLCERHRCRRTIGLTMAVMIPAIAMGGCVMSGATDGWLGFGTLSLLIVPVCLFIANVLPRPIYVDEHLVRLKGPNAD